MSDTIQHTVWIINAGKGKLLHRSHEITNLFLKNNMVMLGWPIVGDLTGVIDNNSIKSKLQINDPNYKKERAAQAASMLNMFANKMQEGDIVIYRPAGSPKAHLGRVAGPYQYNQPPDADYPHSRSVNWLKMIDCKQDLSEKAQDVFTATKSLFQPRQSADEFRQILNGK